MKWSCGRSKHRVHISLFLTTFVALFLALARNHLSQHDNTVTIHERNTGETLAIFECIANKRLLGLETALSHLVRFQRVRVFHFLASSLFAHLPLQFGDTACRTAATHETNRRIAHFDFVGNIKNLDLGIELPRLTQGGVLLVNHHVTRSRHIVLVQTLNVQPYVVTWIGGIDTAVMHLDGEYLACAWI